MGNFAITGLGCSGTAFLASVMNRSEDWTVEHEPGNLNVDFMCAKYVQYRFVDNYGEVNSFLRYDFDRLEVNKKGLILRDPRQIYWSNFENKEGRLLEGYFHVMEHGLQIMKELRSDPDIVKIDFNKMVTDGKYLTEILKEFGITDVRITNEILKKKINKHRRKYFNSYDHIPARFRNRFNAIAEDYINEYY